MSPSAKAKAVSFDADRMWVELEDGRALGVPLAWFPRLAKATPEHRKACRIGDGGEGLHWEGLGEDISLAGLLAGRGDQTKPHRSGGSASESRAGQQNPSSLSAENDTPTPTADPCEPAFRPASPRPEDIPTDGELHLLPNLPRTTGSREARRK